MFRFLRTRRGKGRNGNNSCGVRERKGGDCWCMLYALMTRNLVKENSKNPEGAKMSKESRSVWVEATGRIEVVEIRWG